MKVLIFILVFLTSLIADNRWYYDALSLKTISPNLNKSKENVTIAIIDDAFLLSHRDLKPLWFKNLNEIPNNSIDDDKNGYIDDFCGWDASDNDSEVIPPKKRASDYGHGTYVAGVIADITNQIGTSKKISIIPVKVLSDNATSNYLKDAYAGFNYALDMKADIIVAAWGGGRFGKDERALLQRAEQQGAIVVASAGNNSREVGEYPALFPTAVAVAGIDRHGAKFDKSSYGEFVTISAPADSIVGSSVFSDTTNISDTGTSAATAITAAAIASYKVLYPKSTTLQIKAELMNSARPLEGSNPSYAGKLGAGLLNISQFLSPKLTKNNYLLQRKITPKGFYALPSKLRKSMTWNLYPEGEYYGSAFDFRSIPQGSLHGELHVKGLTDTLFEATYLLDTLQELIFLPVKDVSLTFEIDKNRIRDLSYIPYYMRTIDSTSIYCGDTVTIEDSIGTISDGSGYEMYSGNNSCSWILKAGKDKTIEIDVDSIDIDKSDLLYIFDGEFTNSPILIRMNGTTAPPRFRSSGNNVLLWFVTDKKHHSNGWVLDYRHIDN